MNRIIRIFLSLVIAISPILLINNANAAIAGWALSNPIAQGASTVYDATKTVLINGKNVVKTSSIAIAPTAANVAKVLARGGAAAALSVAVEQLLGAVDWVLDPANNQITYKPNPTTENVATPYIYRTNAGTSTDSSSPYHSCSKWSAPTDPYWNRFTFTLTNSGVDSLNRPIYQCNRVWYSDSNNRTSSLSSYTSAVANNPSYDDSDRKTLPLDTVASKVIQNATAGDSNAQVATMAAAADIVNEAESDNVKALPISTALDQAAVTETTETATGEATQTKTDPTTGEPVTETTDLALEFPTFCGWAPIVCEAAQVVISVPQAVSEAWATTKEWLFADEPLPESETTDISQLPIPELEENAISWSAQCPNDVDIPINLQGVSSTITFSWSPWCQLLSMIKPAIIASAYIGAAFIVLGLRT